MSTDYISQLIEIARRKNTIDQEHDWSNGSSTYLNEIVKEVDEVRAEAQKDRVPYLEDELGDVLWDYLNVLICFETEKGVDVDRVFRRARQKYEERVSGIESGQLWAEIKEKQKRRLASELNPGQE